MYANEPLIERRMRLSEDVDVYYNIEGIHAPLFMGQNNSEKKPTIKETIKKLLENNAA